MKDVYYSLVYSHIVYGIEAWGSAFKTELDKILILQKRVIRLITFHNIYPNSTGHLRPTDPLFQKLKILKVHDIYRNQMAKFVYKSLHRLTPNNFHDWFHINSDLHSYRTRSNFNVQENNQK